MAIRIGGPRINGFNPSYPTWASQRCPLILDSLTWNATYTEFANEWPLSAESPPKFFKWNNGSLFRKDNSGLPYIVIASQEEPYEPEIVFTSLYLGVFYSAVKTVENDDFKELVGELINTDAGSFTINEDAHKDGGQLLSSSPPGGTEIYSIGKLTGF
jgi:hypothetical protein